LSRGRGLLYCSDGNSIAQKSKATLLPGHDNFAIVTYLACSVHYAAGEMINVVGVVRGIDDEMI
jgi:hypothetical protein